MHVRYAPVVEELGVHLRLRELLIHLFLYYCVCACVWINVAVCRIIFGFWGDGCMVWIDVAVCKKDVWGRSINMIIHGGHA